ncbi:MAG TPA: hypothetical protein VF596_20345, partial [Pyrinomonadaceae bacterium]
MSNKSILGGLSIISVTFFSFSLFQIDLHLPASLTAPPPVYDGQQKRQVDIDRQRQELELQKQERLLQKQTDIDR